MNVMQIGSLLEVIMIGIVLLIIGVPLIAYAAFGASPGMSIGYVSMVAGSVIVGALLMCFLLTWLLLAPGIIGDILKERRNHQG
jgi:hypothetical protein